jgi:hypothetical protein
MMIPHNRSLRRPLPALLFAILALSAPCAVHAQTVQGRVLDRATQQPVAGAEIQLDDVHRKVGEARSAADGSFRVAAPTPGEYRLIVNQPGYELLISDVVRLGAGQVLQMDVRLVPEAQPAALAQQAPPTAPAPQAAEGPPAQQAQVAQAPLSAERGIGGRVAEAGTRRPVAGATVMLLNDRGQAAGSVVTDARGSFHLPVAAPGRFQLAAQRVGYHRSISQPMTLVPSDAVQVELLVSTDAVVLEPLTVVASSRDVTRNSRLATFEWRRENNPWGRFLGPEQIARIRPFHATDALAQVPFVQISGRPPQRQATLRGRFGNRCNPTIYVDGQRIPAPAGRFDAPDRSDPRMLPFSRSFPVKTDAAPAGAGVNLDDLVSGADIVAVEVYDRPFEAPAEFSPAEVQINCGVIVVWTRQSAREG